MMTPDINIMRQEVAAMYPGPKWKRRVSKMADDQVTAIYLKKIQAPKVEETKQDKKDEPDIPF